MCVCGLVRAHKCWWFQRQQVGSILLDLEFQAWPVSCLVLVLGTELLFCEDIMTSLLLRSPAPSSGCFGIWFHCVIQAGFDLEFSLPQLLKGWSYKCVPIHLLGLAYNISRISILQMIEICVEVHPFILILAICILFSPLLSILFNCSKEDLV